MDVSKGTPGKLDDQSQLLVEQPKRKIAKDSPEEKEAAKRAVLHAAEQTRAAALAATELAATENVLADKEIEELQQARQTAAVQLASEVAAHYKPPSKPRESESESSSAASVPTAQAPTQPGIPPAQPVAKAQAAIPPDDPMNSAGKGVHCQKFLYEVANQTAVKASAQMSSARALASTAQDPDTLQAAKGQAEIAQRNMALAQQMAAAAHSPSIAVQAVAAMQQACSGGKQL